MHECKAALNISADEGVDAEADRKEYPLICPGAFDAMVIITPDGRIANNGVANPYPSPSYARAHAEALLWACNELAEPGLR